MAVKDRTGTGIRDGEVAGVVPAGIDGGIEIDGDVGRKDQRIEGGILRCAAYARFIVITQGLLMAGGAGQDIVLNADVESATGNVSLVAVDSVLQNSGADVATSPWIDRELYPPVRSKACRGSRWRWRRRRLSRTISR